MGGLRCVRALKIDYISIGKTQERTRVVENMIVIFLIPLIKLSK